MKLYFECAMGAAGDMLAAALVDLFDDREAITEKLNRLSLPHTTVVCTERQQNGIAGVHLDVIIDGETETPDTHHHHHHHHTHRTLPEVLAIIDALTVPDAVKDDIRAIYRRIADAEASAHHAPVSEVHFHELGMLDAIADITLCAYLIHTLQPESITCSPINVGGGTVHCAHGELPVPAPATAHLLTGIPYYKSTIQTELCTPTGAAVLQYFADAFSETPAFRAVQRIGIGTGTKQLERANILRVYAYEDSTVTELACNLDDMTGEEAAFAAEQMMANGALDCFISPILMKKGRPAYLLTVLCQLEDKEQFIRLLFKHTTTLGIRQYTPSRYTLDRTLDETAGVHIKRSAGYGTVKEKIEFEDIKALALEQNISVFEAREALKQRYEEANGKGN